MNSTLMSATHRPLLMLGLLLLAAAWGSGCQTGGQLISVQEADVCPLCRTEVRTAAIAGGTCETHTCAGCTAAADSSLWGEVPEFQTAATCTGCAPSAPQCNTAQR